MQRMQWNPSAWLIRFFHKIKGVSFLLDEIDLDVSLKKDDYKKSSEVLSSTLSELARKCKELNIPVIVVFEGWGASGKGTLINNFIMPLDPRLFKVYTIKKATEDEKMRPFLWRFWTKTPAKGQMAIFDRSWYRRVMNERADKQIDSDKIASAYDEILSFEKQLVDDGVVIIKFFLHISEHEQRKRFEKLESSPETAWRVTEDDWENHKRYSEFLEYNDEMLQKTNSPYAPWTVIEATDRRFASNKIMKTAIDILVKKISSINKDKETPKIILSNLKSPILGNLDLSKSITKDEYSKKLKSLQNRLSALHNEIYTKRIGAVMVFEGQDAAGKGGAIKRITENLDPRGYEVVPTAAPNDLENAHHYLWRFWNSIPKLGHITIFDRSWYGRVMVERVEGFCTENEWKRAYSEINEMEQQIVNSGILVIKFWLQIDKDEQERRFNARLENPQKRWKITDEDWRNREKWDEYTAAVDEMLERTQTPFAPWTIVEANNKLFARIKVLETVAKRLEESL